MALRQLRPAAKIRSEIGMAARQAARLSVHYAQKENYEAQHESAAGGGRRRLGGATPNARKRHPYRR